MTCPSTGTVRASLSAALVGCLAATAALAEAQPRTPLKNVVADQVIQAIAYCRGEYRLTMASGEQKRFPEVNLRFKTDASTYGPDPGKPVLLPAGMRGDRAQAIFSGVDDLKRLLVERCEGDTR